jgi:hypothetical protein
MVARALSMLWACSGGCMFTVGSRRCHAQAQEGEGEKAGQTEHMLEKGVAGGRVRAE